MATTKKQPLDFCEERRKSKKPKEERLKNWEKVIGNIIDFEDNFLILTEIEMPKNIEDMDMEELLEKRTHFASQRDFYRAEIKKLLSPLLMFDMQVRKPAQCYQNWYYNICEEIKERNASKN